MTRATVGVVLMLAVTGPGGGAWAQEVPAWCGTNRFEVSSYDVKKLSDGEPDDTVRAIARASCSTTEEANAERANINKARAAWSQKLGMVEADWADAVAFIDNRDGNFPKAEYSQKVLSKLTPMDQWRAIRGKLDLAGKEIADAFYAADALDGQLSETGRLAFLEFCFNERLDHDNSVLWAVCAPDVAAWDFAKFATELRGDSAHDGPTRILLRLRGLKMKESIQEWNGERDKLFAKDDTYKKMFEVAAKARLEWKKGIGSNAALLELVQSMDSATAASSRKQFAECEAKTAEALANAVATLPAKAFDGMSDVRDDPYAGFAHKAGPLLVNTPVVNLAANAFAQCHKGRSGAGDWLSASLQEVPGFRGPRTAAIGALFNEKFEFDDTSARAPSMPQVGDRPYARSGGSIHSAGGVVAKATPGKDFLTVALQKTTAKRLDCVSSKRTNRVTRILSDGRLEYESICLKSAVVTYDTTWTDFKINPAHLPLLKPGVVFSSVQLYDWPYADVVAIWPDKNATAPSMVLGAKLK